jgi:hypothetical protein
MLGKNASSVAEGVVPRNNASTHVVSDINAIQPCAAGCDAARYNLLRDARSPERCCALFFRLIVPSLKAD